MSVEQELPPVRATAIEHDMTLVDRTNDHMSKRRLAMLARMDKAVDNALAKLETASDRDEINASIDVIEAASRLMGQEEKAVIDRAKVKLKHRETEIADNTNQNVAEMLHQIAVGKLVPQPPAAPITKPDDLEAASKALFEGLEGVEIATTELRASPKDLA